MGKGILMEVSGRTGVVLTPQGEFKRVPLPRRRCDIGDEIEFADRREAPWLRWGVFAAAAVLMLLLAPAGYQSWALAQPWAVVTVDINPSVELTLNRRSEVLQARGLNEDGQQVLREIDWQRRPVDEVLAEVTEQAIAAEKLNVADESSAVVVAVAPLREEELPAEQVQTIRAAARAAVEEEIREEAQVRRVEPKANVAAVVASAREREEARQSGLSPGKWVLLQEIRSAAGTEAEAEVEAEDLQEMGPAQLAKSLGLEVGQLFRQAEEHHGGRPEVPGKAIGREKQAGEERPGNGKKGRDDADRPGGGPAEDRDQPASGAGQEGRPGGDSPGNGKKDPPGRSDEEIAGQGAGKPGQTGPGNGKAKGADDPAGGGDDRSGPGNGRDDRSGPGGERERNSGQDKPAAPANGREQEQKGPGGKEGGPAREDDRSGQGPKAGGKAGRGDDKAQDPPRKSGPDDKGQSEKKGKQGGDAPGRSKGRSRASEEQGSPFGRFLRGLWKRLPFHSDAGADMENAVSEQPRAKAPGAGAVDDEVASTGPKGKGRGR